MHLGTKILNTLLKYEIPKSKLAQENSGLKSVLSFHLSHTHDSMSAPLFRNHSTQFILFSRFQRTIIRPSVMLKSKLYLFSQHNSTKKKISNLNSFHQIWNQCQLYCKTVTTELFFLTKCPFSTAQICGLFGIF